MTEPDTNPPQVDLSNCEDEPIHVPGAIQPHGLFVGCDAASECITHISDNCRNFCGETPQALLGQPVASIFRRDSFADSQIAILRSVADAKPHYLFTVGLAGPTETFDAIAHRNGNTLYAEFERSRRVEGPSTSDLYRLVQRAISRLQSAKSVREIAGICALHVRRISGFDRVMVYRFDEEWNGQVIAEEREYQLEPFLGLHYPASDIPRQARELYTENWLRFIPDRDYAPSRLVAQTADAPPLDLSFSVLRSVSPIHIEYLRNMGVRASMSISLVRDGRLWGLIACHHYSGRRLVPYDVRTACELLGQFMSLHLPVAEEREHRSARIAAAEVRERILQNIEAAEDAPKALVESRPDILQMIHADGGAVVVGNDVRRIGQTPSEQQIRELVDWLSEHTQDSVFATDQLQGQFGSGLLGGVAAGLLAISVSAERPHRVLWFRTEQARTVDWAGDPSKSVAKGDGFARLSPRGSFSLWKETVRGRSLPWGDLEIEAATTLRDGMVRLLLRRSEQLAAAHSNLRLASEEREKILDSERAARMQAERINRVKDEFVATVSHELRTPLNAILGWAQLLSRREGLDEELTDGLGAIERNARSQAQIVSDLLDVGGIITGKLRLDLKRTRLPTIVEDAIETVTLAATAKNIRIETMLDPLSDVETTGDPGRLQQVVWNLLANAVKFTPKGGKIQVVLQRVQSHVELSVADSGQGIRPQDLPYVFDRFRQADSKTNRWHGGLGLGLSIVRHLVELHGGTVHVESAGEGRGATFVVCLPLRVVRRSADDEHDAVAPTATEVEGLKLAGLRVLVVDDEADARELIRRIFDECDCQVETAASADEALELLRAAPYDVIVSDIGMPGQDGYAFLRSWRKIESESGSAKTPAIALTAYVRAEDRQRSLLAGYQSHLSKPVDRGELLTLAASLAGRI
ncbi:MAG: hybrid sensor histidine kinase/response regulator [Planctomycetota bacterium]|nr:MAG: hybrid sensor histidine kinase/response regulator [Planctomycetota bacterium]